MTRPPRPKPPPTTPPAVGYYWACDPGTKVWVLIKDKPGWPHLW